MDTKNGSGFNRAWAFRKPRMDAKTGLDSTTNGREWTRKMGVDSTVHGRLGNHEWTRRSDWIQPRINANGCEDGTGFALSAASRCRLTSSLGNKRLFRYGPIRTRIYSRFDKTPSSRPFVVYLLPLFAFVRGSKSRTRTRELKLGKPS
jgi:hypothetical protein